MTNNEIADLWSKAIVRARLEDLPEPIVFARMVIDRHESAAVGALREIDAMVGSCADAIGRVRQQSALIHLLARVAEAEARQQSSIDGLLARVAEVAKRAACFEKRQ